MRSDVRMPPEEALRRAFSIRKCYRTGPRVGRLRFSRKGLMPVIPWMETISLLVLLVAVWFWLDSFKAREAAIRAARAACDAEHLLLLDDTVALGSLRPQRDELGRLCLRRVYNFEYSDTGDNRRNGHATLLGSDLLLLHLPNAPAPALRSLSLVSEDADQQSPQLPL